MAKDVVVGLGSLDFIVPMGLYHSPKGTIMDRRGDRVAANVEMRRAWDGPEGDNWSANETFYNEASRFLTPHLLNAAALRITDSVLDVGCGNGQTTRLAASIASEGSTFGIDLSAKMIERARARAEAEGLQNARFEVSDAQTYPFPQGAFDVALSRHGVMFFDDPVAAFSNISRALTPGGRLAMLAWRDLDRNEWVSEIRRAMSAGRLLPSPPPGMPGPFAFADQEFLRRILSTAGFDDVEIASVDEPIFFGATAGAAFESVQKLGVVLGLLAELDKETRAEALEKLRETIEARETPDGVLFRSSNGLVRAQRAQ
jgi:SAM-dependent methyltransferase